MGYLGYLIQLIGDKLGVSFLSEFSLPEGIDLYVCLGALGLTLVLFILHLVGNGVNKKDSNAAYAASVSKYLADNGEINDGNVAPFTDTCFGDKAPAAYKDGWTAFLDTRFGYPSESFEKSQCVKTVRTKKSVKANGFLFAGITLFVIAFGLIGGAYDDIDYLVLMYTALYAIPVLTAFGYWMINVRARKIENKLAGKEEAAFDALMEDLDANVALQQYFDYQRDTSDLSELADAINEIADFENNKPAVHAAPVEEPVEEEVVEEEPVEDLFAVEEEPVEEVVEEEVVEEPVEEVVEEVVEEPVEEVVDEVVEEVVEEPVEEPAEVEEETVEEEVAAEEEAVEEVAEPAPQPTAEEIKNAQIFGPFMTVLNKTLRKGYNRATLKKVAKIAILAYKKFDKPEQREEIKDFIRKFIVTYSKAKD